MTNYLDRFEAISSLVTDFECSMSVNIHCTRLKYEQLTAEIEDEYDLSLVEDISITTEKIPNQLSNIHVVNLHGQKIIFHIKD